MSTSIAAVLLILIARENQTLRLTKLDALRELKFGEFFPA
jgi:hypothetical protein